MKANKVDYFKIFLRLLYAVSLVLYCYLLWDGLSYYQTPLIERPHSPEYRTLRPAGDIGQGYGVAGATMMILMQLYSVRKRTRFFGNWGALSRWLDIHIYFGIMGPLLIILHTTFKVNGIIAVSFWAMIAVATSGILGRYLYLQIPRRRTGEALAQKEIIERHHALDRELQEEAGLDAEAMKEIEKLNPLRVNPNSSLLPMLIRTTMQDIAKPLLMRRLRRQLEKKFGLHTHLLNSTMLLTYQKFSLERRTALLNRVQQLFHYWHVFHKPFAYLMFIIMFVHIGVAVWLGYTWIF